MSARMTEGYSSTAALSAMMRAAHLLLDGEPKIFSDRLALQLSGVESEAALKSRLEELEAANESNFGPHTQAVFAYMRAMMALRSRCAEDELIQAVQRGVRQYVILGAGLDSFAYRETELAGTLQVFEVDVPASQQWKRARLRALGITEPDHLVLVPVDFERQLLVEALQAKGFRADEPAFLSWLGTTQYLTEEAVFKTLAEIASLAPGSEIIFQYQLSEHLLDDSSRRLRQALMARFAAIGEPWLSLFDPIDLAQRVKAVGFSEAVDYRAEKDFARYFIERTDSLPTPHLCCLMKARV
jgi:methyltransferase (TIGR00027 family)